MKKIILFFLGSLVLFAACKENQPVIPPLGGGVDSERKVLIEEFTGVRCTNCPDGSAEILNLIALHGENLIAVSIHSGPFSEPYPENQYDFRTEAGDEIAGMVGSPLGYPSAVIDRRMFEGENGLQLTKSKWAGYIQNELAEAPQFNLSIESNFDPATRSLTAKVTAVALDAYTESVALTVLLTEDHIKDVQAFPSGLQNDYDHRHVFRRLLTAQAAGEDLGNAFAKGQIIQRQYTVSIPAEWNADECHIVAFVHHNSGDLRVLQAEEVKMIE